MATKLEDEKVISEDNLLTSREQATCEQIAKGEAPHSLRALALLALNEGNTQTQAAEKAGLSTGQVKYWLSRFRKQGLAIFPDDMLDELVAEVEVEKKVAVKDKPKGKKDKKGKKAKKKTKKAKKDKKGKKGKKSKKKAEKAKKK
jgi:hypothetical protein